MILSGRRQGKSWSIAIWQIQMMRAVFCRDLLMLSWGYLTIPRPIEVYYDEWDLIK